jgi:hypothetical protein
MNYFKRYYLYGMVAKSYVGLYFMSILVVIAAMHWIQGVRSIEFVTLLQMLALCIVLGNFEAAVVDPFMDASENIFTVQGIALIFGAFILSFGTSLALGWFEGMPSWYNWALGLFMAGACIAMLFGKRYQKEAKEE